MKEVKEKHFGYFELYSDGVIYYLKRNLKTTEWKAYPTQLKEFPVEEMELTMFMRYVFSIRNE